MKILLTLFLLLILYNPVYSSEYQPNTQADIIQNAQNNLIKSNKHFDVVCDKIRNNFDDDKKFLN